MKIDHIFIFTDDNGKVADQLVQFGLTEGSHRVHHGQGTTNRNFYFENFYLEILWVHNENEIKSAQTKPTGLWKRADCKTNHFSPFGLCIVNTDETDLLFEKSLQYQPDFFPNELSIDILTNEHQPDLPWMFRLPFMGQNIHENEPKKHSNGIAHLTRAIFECKDCRDRGFLEYFQHDTNIQFRVSPKIWLNLIFDEGKQRKRRDFEKLKLTIEY